MKEMTPFEAAEKLEVSHTAVLMLIYRQKIKARKEGRDWKIPVKEVEKWERYATKKSFRLRLKKT